VRSRYAMTTPEIHRRARFPKDLFQLCLAGEAPQLGHFAHWSHLVSSGVAGGGQSHGISTA